MVSTVSSLSHSNPSRTTASLGGDSVHEESYRSRLAKATTQEQVEAILVEKMETCHRLTPRDCLFCPSEGFGNVEETLMHMATQHCFFVPDAEFLSDPEGLVQYLADKIAVANVCIFCNGKGRTMHSTEAVRAHMVILYFIFTNYQCRLVNRIARYRLKMEMKMKLLNFTSTPTKMMINGKTKNQMMMKKKNLMMTKSSTWMT